MGIEGPLGMLVPRLQAAATRRAHLADGRAAELLRLLADEYPPTSFDDDPLADLVDAFELTPLDANLLTIAAAPELDVRFGAVFGLLLDSDRWWSTVGQGAGALRCGIAVTDGQTPAGTLGAAGAPRTGDDRPHRPGTASVPARTGSGGGPPPRCQ